MLTACASFPQTTPTAPDTPAIADAAAAPALYLDVESGVSTSVRDEAISALKTSLRDADAVSQIVDDPSQADRVLEVRFDQKPTSFASTLGPVITGFSYMLIPTYSTIGWTMDIHGRTQDGDTFVAAETAGSMRLWLGIWLIPAMPGNSPPEIRKQVLAAMADDAVAQITGSDRYFLN
jgi:hypothetical protein